MDKKVEFRTSTKFEISEEEQQHLYTLMALVQFPYQCNPEYRDLNLIRRLRNEFNRYNMEIIKACENDPNNLTLNQIRIFMQHHYGCLKKVTKRLEPQE